MHLFARQGWQRESKPFETGQNENYALFGIKFMNNELPSSSMCALAAATAAVLRSPASLQEFILCHNYTRTLHTHTHPHTLSHTFVCCVRGHRRLAPLSLPADQKVLSSVVIVKRQGNHKDMHSKQHLRVDNREQLQVRGPLFCPKRFAITV